MQYNFREMVDKLRKQGHVEDIYKSVDIRHIAALVDKSDKALVFHNVNDYAMPVVSGISNGRERIGAAFDCPYGEVYKRIDEGLSNPIPPAMVNDGPVQEIILTGEDVDSVSYTHLTLPTKA